MNLVINKSYLVEVNFATISANQRYYFNDVPQLSQRQSVVYIQGIEAFDATGLTVSPNNKNVIGTTAAAAAANLICTFSVKDTEEIYQIPYFTLIGRQNGGVIRTFMNKQINLVKSYVTLVSITGVTAAESAVFNFYYK